MSYWVVIPAAGVGARMGTERPKQYLPLRGKPVIEHCLDRLAAHPKVSGVVLALGQDDGYGAQFFSRPLWNGKPLHRVVGGAQRSHSVLNALVRLAEIAELDDWVLVHDAVRPCLRHADIDKLIATLEGHPVGGLLGVPVSDTIKRVAADHRVVETIARLELWRALTPQMFRLAALIRALTEAIERGIEITDDAAAMSLAGAVPVMIEGHADNIKITHPADLALAEFYLTRQEELL